MDFLSNQTVPFHIYGGTIIVQFAPFTRGAHPLHEIIAWHIVIFSDIVDQMTLWCRRLSPPSDCQTEFESRREENVVTTAGRFFGKGRRLATVSAVAMSALLLVSCGEDDEEDEATTEATEVVTRATVPPVATDEPVDASPEASPMAATPVAGGDEATPEIVASDASPAPDDAAEDGAATAVTMDSGAATAVSDELEEAASPVASPDASPAS